ncbi:hypothetical protein M427DRAFT_165997 [Gonapodya prolifera JEL478]|uniref:Uncharacterized protein n=1 Tax=Gonapodya prolifera (strain JEL478) TaxID=1344416 RepID=A0A139AZM4_GONPJ|nr:hypothetical protein M427DRAFT_165997 [Gonapodya prolifera JEL478]|eukprot:KXS22150.1 hypothetical protein M427DRAFT_165997 [Gonapodya prolifera JEL478]
MPSSLRGKHFIRVKIQRFCLLFGQERGRSRRFGAQSRRQELTTRSVPESPCEPEQIRRSDPLRGLRVGAARPRECRVGRLALGRARSQQGPRSMWAVNHSPQSFFNCRSHRRRRSPPIPVPPWIVINVIFTYVTTAATAAHQSHSLSCPQSHFPHGIFSTTASPPPPLRCSACEIVSTANLSPSGSHLTVFWNLNLLEYLLRDGTPRRHHFQLQGLCGH